MSFPALLTDTCVVQRYAGASGYGPTYDPPVTVACRVEDVTELVRDDTGEEIVSTARLFTLPEAPVTARSRVTVAGRTTTVISVTAAAGRAGVHHLEARLR